MARTPDSPEVKEAKGLATKVVARLVKEGLVEDAKAAKAAVTAVILKASTPAEIVA